MLHASIREATWGFAKLLSRKEEYWMAAVALRGLYDKVSVYTVPPQPPVNNNK